MMKTVRHLTPILLLLVGSLFATSCSVPPVREAPRVKTFTAPWSSWYFSGSHSGYVQGQKAAFLPDGDVIIVSHERRSFRIDRFDSELRAVDTLTIPRDRDDEYVRLFVGEDATHVVTLAEEKDSLAIRHRRIPHDSFVPTAQTTVHRIFDDLEGWIPVRMAFSPDSNYVLLWSFGEDNDYDDPTSGEEWTIANVDAVVLDLRDGSTRAIAGMLRLPDGFDTDDGYRRAVIDNKGIATILMLGEMRSNWATYVLRSNGSTWETSTAPFSTAGPEILSAEHDYDDKRGMYPHQFDMDVTASGQVVFVVPLYFKDVSAVVRGEIDPASLAIQRSTIMTWTEEIVERLTLGAEEEFDNTWNIESLIAHEDGSTTILYERVRVSESFTSNKSSRAVGPYLVVRIGADEEIVASSFIPVGTTYPTTIQMIEPFPMYALEGTTMTLGLRSRGDGGFTVYTISLEEPYAPLRYKTVALLDDQEHLTLSKDIVWRGTNGMLLPVRMKANGGDFTLMLLSWEKE